MKGDFSRLTFDPARHFSGVRMQQGRVQLDADWNEQVDLARARVETGTVDEVGHCGGPLHDAGFRIVALKGAPQPVKDAVKAALPGVNVNDTDDLVILPGRYYVDGVLVQCDAPVLFGSQPDRPDALPLVAKDPAHGLAAGDYVLYLDVWDRHLTALEEPSLRERALGGPDTATRTRTVWQVRALPCTGAEPDCQAPEEWDAFLKEPARSLRARSQPAGPDQGPCVVPAGAGYRGLENQLYRVEIHTPGAPDAGGAGKAVTAYDPQDPAVVTVPGGGWAVGDTVLLYPTKTGGLLRPTLAQVSNVNGNKLTLTAPFQLSLADDKPELRKVTGATFKWSRDNGIAVSRATALSNDGLRVSVESLGQDEVLGFRSGDWVELSDEYTELNGLPGWLAVVDRLNPAAREVVLRTPFPTLAANQLDFANRKPKLRRWDGLGIAGPGPEPQGFHALEDGVEVAFDGAGPFRSGDWWVVPARAATAENEQGGNVEWPMDVAGGAVALPPFGIRHHRCRLGTVNVDPTQAPSVTDCRCLFPPLTEVRALHYVGGAGQEAMPDFSSPTARPELALPLLVGVGNGHCHAGGRVRFHVETGDGDIRQVLGGYGGDLKNVYVEMGAGGVAGCFWRLGRASYAQTVTATLQERVYQHPGDPTKDLWIDVPGSIVFNASLSIASEVGYLPEQNCTPMARQFTVQNALTHLSRLTSLHPAGGDGQEARPGHELPCRLAVLASSACGPVSGAKVKFTVHGGGTLLNVDGTTGGDGIARARWQLGGSGCQQVTAVLQDDPDRMAEPRTVVFTATLSTADQVAYKPDEKCGMTGAKPPVETVQEALDWLCAHRGGGGCSVTVGAGGDFATLAQALALLKTRAAVNVCLLPGEHRVTGPIALSRSDGSVKITGNGVATPVLFEEKGAITAGPLAAFTLRDVEILSANAPVLTFDGCGDVEVEKCFIVQAPHDKPVVAVKGAVRVRIADNWMFAFPAPQAAAPVVGLAPDARAVVGGKLTEAFLSTARGFRRTASLAALSDTVATPRRRGGGVGAMQQHTHPTGEGVRPRLAGDVLALLDGGGSVHVENNVFWGNVRLYGAGPAPTPQELNGMLDNVRKTRLAQTGGAFYLRGNQLWAVRLDAKGMGPVSTPTTGVAPYRVCSVTENTFFDAFSHVLAAQVNVGSNQFANEVQGDALVAAATSATAVSNLAVHSDTTRLWLAVPGSPSASAAAPQNANLVRIFFVI